MAAPRIGWYVARLSAYLNSLADYIDSSELVSGSSIKTINGSSLLGSGDLLVAGRWNVRVLSADATSAAGDWCDVSAAGGSRVITLPAAAANTGLTIQVRREFGGRSCNAVLRHTRISVSTDSTKGAVFTVYRNPTVAGTTAHAYVDETNSIALYDAAGTTVTGGRILTAITIGPSGSGSINMDEIGTVLVAGDELVITAAVTSGSASQMDATVTWEEIV